MSIIYGFGTVDIIQTPIVWVKADSLLDAVCIFQAFTLKMKAEHPTIDWVGPDDTEVTHTLHVTRREDLPERADLGDDYFANFS